MAPAPNGTAANQPREKALDGWQLACVIVEQLRDDKAESIVTIDLEGKSSVADMMIIASGRSQRHVGALADLLSRDLKDRGYGKVAIEGIPTCDWVLLDVGDVIVHIFRPEVRDFYNLERIWSPEAFTETEENSMN